jgi:hypothetical protein
MNNTDKNEIHRTFEILYAKTRVPEFHQVWRAAPIEQQSILFSYRPILAGLSVAVLAALIININNENEPNASNPVIAVNESLQNEVEFSSDFLLSRDNRIDEFSTDFLLEVNYSDSYNSVPELGSTIIPGLSEI